MSQRQTTTLILAALPFALSACDSGSGSTANDGSGAGSAVTSSATGNPIACSGEMSHTGDGTFYAADGTGNCSFDKSPDLMVAAMNHTDYAASAVCGECVQVDGPSGSVTVRIVDQCPECKPGDIDLSAEAFAKMADPKLGRVKISWKVVSCGVTGPIQYRFKEGANPYWTAVQIRNAQNAILQVEAMKGGAYEKLMRADYNYFIDASGLGPGPYQFRVTDVYGHVLEDPAIPFGEAMTFAGAAQFPACP